MTRYWLTAFNEYILDHPVEAFMPRADPAPGKLVSLRLNPDGSGFAFSDFRIIEQAPDTPPGFTTITATVRVKCFHAKETRR